VTDRECRPIANAVVDIWQANHEGRYNHSLDASNPRPLDPNFQSRGIALTDSEGRYNFKSIIPGAYPASADWMRPSHVHFRVSSVGFRELTTQMYFQGTPYLNEDRILQSLSPEERQAVVIDFAPRALNNGEVVRVCIFPIILQRI
jgi:protocatechuate 3,4-dioxygenase beta subunit